MSVPSKLEARLRTPALPPALLSDSISSLLSSHANGSGLKLGCAVLLGSAAAVADGAGAVAGAPSMFKAAIGSTLTRL